MNDQLVTFVRDALSRGLSRAEVERALNQAGWSSEQVSGALGAFADVSFPIPVPRPQPSLSAKEGFTYLLLFTTLYLVAFNLGRILFELINRAFPDAALPASDAAIRSSLRFATSSLLVAGPVFLYVSWLANRAVRADPTRRTSPIRRWLTYLTLFISACVLIGDVTSLLYNFLGGELTTRFVLKAGVVGAIAGASFWYYLSDLRDDERLGDRS